MLNIYKASAGSGKTFNLAYWYIKLLLGEIDPETGRYSLARGRLNSHAAILAVTFTNKATQEMKERIISELATLAATPAESNYIKRLQDDLHTTDVGAISSTAREALASLLFNFSLFNISTIDSFFQQILRSFAIEVDRPANFTVEMDELLIMDMSVDEMFENLDKDKDIREWIRLFMLYKFEENETVNLFDKESGLHSNLVSTITGFMSEEYRLNRDLIDGYLKQPDRVNQYYKYLTKNIAKIREKIKADALALLTTIEVYPLSKNAMTWIKALAKDGTYKNISETLKTIAYSDPDKAFTGKKKDEIPTDIKHQVQAVFTYFIDTFEKIRLAELLRKQLFFFGLLGKVTSISERICRENNIILLSNTNELINKIIGKNPDISPFIYERVGNRIHNFLMDEFQDTSALQWLNMKPLLQESLAVRNDNLIIGDEKQCIYRFRNSSPELLSYQVRQQIEHEYEIDEQGNRIEENTNWRSTPEVIRFNNTLFFALGQQIEPGSAYAHVMQGISPKNEWDKGHVSVRFFETPKKEKSDEGDGKEKKTTDSNALENIVLDATINELRRLFKHYSPGEIAILVDKNKQGEKIIARMLKAMEGENPELPRFEIISNDALRVSSAASVKMLVNQLRLSESPEKTVEEHEEQQPAKQWVKRTSSDFATLEHKFEKYYSDLRNNVDSAAGRALTNALYDDILPKNILNEAMKGHQCNDLVSVVERLIGELPDKMKEEETIFISAFQDLVMNYSDRGNGDIRGFLLWWDKIGVGAKINSPENKSALTVSTIHKSKGLEYPCVLIPFANWVFQEDSSSNKTFFNWYEVPQNIFEDEEPSFAPKMLPLKKEKKLSETLLKEQYERINEQQHVDALNLTYVAFTRAKRELVIFVQDPYKNKEHGLAEYLRKALKESYSAMIEDIDKINKDESAKALALLHNAVMDFSKAYNSEEGYLEYGETNRLDLKKKAEEEAKKKKETKKEDSKKEVETKTEPMPVYTARDNEKTLKFMRLADEEDFDPENARQKGVYMHYVLSKVIHQSSLHYACLQRGQKISMDHKVIEERYQQLKAAIEYPPVQRWFNDFKRVLSERGLHEMGEEKLRRPDRVVWTADGFIDVVDFKFGDKKNYKDYESQVQGYVNRLRRAGYEKVRGYLWYPLDNFIHTVYDDDNESLV